MIPPFDESTGGLPAGDHVATLSEIEQRLGFSGRRRWLLNGLRTAVEAFWAAGIEEIFIDGSFCTTKPEPGDIDGYWIEPDPGVFDRIDPYWIDFEPVFIPTARKMRWRMWADHCVEFFIHPSMDATPGVGFPQFFRRDRDGRPRGVVKIVKEYQDDQDRRTEGEDHDADRGLSQSLGAAGCY